MPLFFIYHIRSFFPFRKKPIKLNSPAAAAKSGSGKKKEVFFLRFLADQTETQVISVVSAVAARGQCNSLSPTAAEHISSHPPSSCWHWGKRHNGGKHAHTPQEQWGNWLEKRRQFTDRVSWSCFLLAHTALAAFKRTQLALHIPSASFYIPSLHPILQILQTWAHLSLTLVCSHTDALSTSLNILRPATLCCFPAQCWPQGLWPWLGEVTVLLWSLGVWQWADPVAEPNSGAKAATGTPSPTGGEGVTGEWPTQWLLAEWGSWMHERVSVLGTITGHRRNRSSWFLWAGSGAELEQGWGKPQ